MEMFRIAAVSMNGLIGQPERNLATIAAWCEQAAAEKAELVLFPELVVHGHCTPNTWELAEPIPDGPSVQRLLERDGVPLAQVVIGAASRSPGEPLTGALADEARQRVQHVAGNQ